MESQRKTVIYVVRHGECIGNATRKVVHPDEAILTENGKLQAKLLGQHLDNINFTLAYTSPSLRTEETARIILGESKLATNLDLKQDARIREKSLGKYELGTGYGSIIQDLFASGNFIDFCGKDGETSQEVEDRLEKFLEELFLNIDASPEPQTILVVSHAILMLQLWNCLNNCPTKYEFTNWKPEYFKLSRNTGYFILETEKLPSAPITVPPRKIKVQAALCADHLKSLDGKSEGTKQNSTSSEKVLRIPSECVQQ